MFNSECISRAQGEFSIEFLKSCKLYFLLKHENAFIFYSLVY